MKEDDRLEMLRAGADKIDALLPDNGEVQNITHNMRKIAAFIVDRDAGPTMDAKAEARRLATELELANGVAKQIDEEYMAYREKTKAMVRECEMLRNEVAGLKASEKKE